MPWVILDSGDMGLYGSKKTKLRSTNFTAIVSPKQNGEVAL